MSNKLNPDFRPDSYWSTDSLLRSLTGNISGTWRRRLVGKALEASDVFPLLQHLMEEHLSEEQRTEWGRIHPSMMGGEYLPHLMPGEVEIARIDMRSVTADVISIRARPTRTRILYRIVDEYDTDYDVRNIWSKHPITLRRLIRLINETQGMNECEGGVVFEILNANVENGCGVEEMAHFITVTSDFYPELQAWYDLATEQWKTARLEEVDQDDDTY